MPALDSLYLYHEELNQFFVAGKGRSQLDAEFTQMLRTDLGFSEAYPQMSLADGQFVVTYMLLAV